MRTFVAPPPDHDLASAPPPSFGVVIAAYQVAPFVGEAVESALSQTLPPLEVIVVDDGSTDDPATALAPYAGRIVLIRQENAGAAAARNRGIAESTADFVVILDGDNALLPEYLQALAELAAARPDLDILTTDAYLELDGEVTGRYYRGKARFVAGDQRRGVIHQHFVFGNCAIRRTALLGVGGYDETVYAEDTDLFVRLILGGSRVGLVDEPLCSYRIHVGSLSSNRPRALREAVIIAERARSHPSLTPDERRYLEAEIAGKRREADLAGAEEALRGFAPHPRRRSLRIVFGPYDYGFAARVKALAAVIAPSLARRYLERLEARTGRSRLALRTHGR